MSLDFRLKPEATPGRHGLSVICQSAISPAADRFEMTGFS